MSRMSRMSRDPRRFQPLSFCAGVLALLTTLLGLTTPLTAQCTEGCMAIHTFTGEAAGDQHGWVSNNVGDLNGDGINDLVLTAPFNDGGGANAGRCYVYSGADGSELFRMTGTAGARLGDDANEAGDIDNDGVGDIIVGASIVGAGFARIYAGDSVGVGTVIHTFLGQSAGDQFGFRVHGGGDFNGDGSPDVVIGAPGRDTGGLNAGRAYVFSGADFTQICAIDGPAAGDRLGSGVSFVGDVNNDGRDDIVVGAQASGPGGSGVAYVYSWDGAACNVVHTLAPGPVTANFGQWFMNGGHDVDNDGTPDIYVNDFGVNRAYIFSGATGLKIWELTGDGTGGFGIGRLVEDINGDGHADMILCAWIQNGGAVGSGKAFIYSGRNASILETFTHDVAGANFGFDANGMGDVNGDGRYDWLVTAASDLGSRGRSYVIAGGVDPAPSDPCLTDPSDCNTNGVPDACEIADGLADDCNDNGIPDECDVVQASSDDCNANGIPDECDLVETLSFGSGHLSPIGVGVPQSFTIVAPPAATITDVTLDILALGEFDGNLNSLVVRLNGTNIGVVLGGPSGAQDCIESTDTLTVSATTFNTIVAGGDALFTFTASPVVHPDFCLDPSFVDVTVSWGMPSALDGDMNGVLDTCECAGDLTGPKGSADGSVDALDFLRLISQWGSPCSGACDADMTGPGGVPDGNVDALDFLVLIGAWGPC